MILDKFCFHAVTSVDYESALCRVSKQIMIHQLPPVLILHMKRFEIGDNEVIKDNRHITFPEILDMAPYCTTTCIEVCRNKSTCVAIGKYHHIWSHNFS